MAHHDTISINALQATGKQRENNYMCASEQSERAWKLSHFHIQKLIFKVLVICRYTVSNYFDILLYYEGPSGGRKGGRF